MEELQNRQIIEIAIAVGGGIIIGWVVKKLLFPFLIKLTHKTKWKSDDLIFESIAKWIIFLFFLASCLYILPILTDTFSFAKRNENIFNDIVRAFFIFSFTMIAARIAGGMLQIRSEREDSEIPTTSILGNIVKAIVYCIGLILILHNFGVAIAPLVTALGVGGIAIALALQPTLSNLFAGLQLIASGKINIGDLVQLETGQRGIIRDITWRNTTIETPQNNIIVVPNSKMADSIIENFFLTDKKIMFNVLVGVAYDSDLEKVENISKQVAKEVIEKYEGGESNFEPFVRFYSFGDSSIDLKIFLRVKEFGDQFPVTSEFIKLLHKRYNQEGIVIPFPIRTVYMNNNAGDK